jgi:hypothetical protein
MRGRIRSVGGSFSGCTKCTDAISRCRLFGSGNLGITSVYLQGIDDAEIIDTVHTRHPPVIPVRTSLPL